MDTDTRPISIRVTIDEIYNATQTTARDIADVRNKLDAYADHKDRIRKLETQMSAVLVVNGIMVAVVTAAATRLMIG